MLKQVQHDKDSFSMISLYFCQAELVSASFNDISWQTEIITITGFIF